jgi:hypothetical protein
MGPARRDRVARGSRRLERIVNITIERVLAEIENCDLVCANCHRLRTKRRGQFTSKRAPEPAEQHHQLELPEAS